MGLNGSRFDPERTMKNQQKLLSPLDFLEAWKPSPGPETRPRSKQLPDGSSSRARVLLYVREELQKEKTNKLAVTSTEREHLRGFQVGVSFSGFEKCAFCSFDAWSSGNF